VELDKDKVDSRVAGVGYGGRCLVRLADANEAGHGERSRLAAGHYPGAGNHATAAAISDNGGLIAYANIDGIFIKATGGETTALQAPADFVVDQLAWFADGTKLVANGFSSITNVPAIWTVSVTGGRANQLRLHTRAGVPSPDGMSIALTTEDRSQIWTMGASGEEARQIIAGAGQDTFRLVFWSADGRRLGFQRRPLCPRAPDSQSPGDTS
jgi:hypothetical protein